MSAGLPPLPNAAIGLQGAIQQRVVVATEQLADDSIDILVTETKSPLDNDSVAASYEPEKDNLKEEDSKEITHFKSEFDELIRLFRAISVLTPLQIRVIELRYLSLLRSYKWRIMYVDALHHFTRIFVSLGSVAVPALLSIQSPSSSNSVSIYWLTWVISLSVTCIHNFVTIFRFDKKYFALHTIYEKLQSEGWAYLQLSGRYAGHNDTTSIIPTHKNQYELFVRTIERIQLKQVSSEYNGVEEKKPPISATSSGAVVNFGSPVANVYGGSPPQDTPNKNPIVK